ncbi:MAG: hypothetical protein ACRYFX_18720 [Janthinobacterium lividum]
MTAAEYQKLTQKQGQGKRKGSGPPNPTPDQSAAVRSEETGQVVLQEATRLHGEQITGRFRFVVSGPEQLKDSTRAALLAALKTPKP